MLQYAGYVRRSKGSHAYHVLRSCSMYCKNPLPLSILRLIQRYDPDMAMGGSNKTDRGDRTADSGYPKLTRAP